MVPLSRRVVVVAALAAGTAPLLGTAPARAQAPVDLDAVADTIIESGYYVDSRAKYFRSDKAQELLRSAQGRVQPVFVAVVPAGNDPNRILAALPGLLERKGTYAVLAGEQLRVRSDTVPATRVKTAYSKAVKTYPGRPDAALVGFVRAMPASKFAPPKPTEKELQGRPAPEDQPIERTLAESQPTGPAAGTEPVAKESSSKLPFAAAGAAVVLAAGGGGFLLWRRRRAKPAAAESVPVPAGAPPAPGGDVPQAPGPDQPGGPATPPNTP